MTIELPTMELINHVLMPMIRMGGEGQLILDNGMLYSTCSTSTTSRSQIVMLAECVASSSSNEKVVMNIGNPKKYADILKNIPYTNISLTYDGVSLSYKDSSPDALVREFRFVLLNDAPSATYDKASVERITYDTTARLTIENLKRVYQLASAPGGPDKMYMETSDGALYCTFTDRSYDGADSIKATMSTSYNGQPISNIIISSDVLSYVVGSIGNKSECSIGFSDGKIVMFEIKNYDEEKSGKIPVSRLVYLTPTKIER